jgi:hypothetical protein
LIGGNLRDVSGMDGHSQWETLLQDKPKEYAVRSEMLLNIDEKLGMSGIRYRQWKLVNGKTQQYVFTVFNRKPERNLRNFLYKILKLCLISSHAHIFINILR